jgi:four helix bundle protein
MSRVNRFEDLKVWQKARALYHALRGLASQGALARDWDMKWTLIRAARSIGLNIAEGFSRRTDKEFSQFLAWAHGSAGEIKCILYYALDDGYLSKEQFKLYYEQTNEVSRMIFALGRYLRFGPDQTDSTD